jgi:hypothetical protein
MLGLFKSQTFVDQQLGKLVRSRGLWRGSVSVGQTVNVPLALSGTRSEPDKQALQIASELKTQFDSWCPTIETALFEHLSPYAEAIADGEFPHLSDQLSKIDVPSQVWPYVSLVFVSVTPMENVLTVELDYTSAWDEDHTLGARFRGGKFLELCGSVLPP